MSALQIGRGSGRRLRQSASGEAVAGLIVAGIASALTWYIVTHGGHRLLLGVAAVIVVGGTAWFACTSRVALALALLMVYLGALDGYLKLSTGSSLVTFVRDLLLWALVAGELIRAAVSHRRMSLPPFSAWVIWFVVFMVVQLFNPQDGSLTHSLAGLRQSLEFVPLFFLTYAYVRTTRALRIFLVLLTVLAVANGIANLVQFRETPQQLASWGPGYSQRVLGGGQFQYAGRAFYDTSGQTHTRPFGLMSDAGSGGLVDAFGLGGIIALALLGRHRRHLLLFAALAALVVTAGLASSQGRAAVICGLVVVITFGGLAATGRGRAFTLLGVAGLTLVAYLSVGQVLSGSASRYSGLSTSQIVQTTQKARGYSIAQIPVNFVRYPVGSGLGSGGPAVGQGGAPAAAGVADSETEFSFLTLESGLPGMLTLVGFTVALLVLGLRRIRKEPDAQARVLLAAILAPIGGICVLYWVSALTPTTPAGPYLWGVGGILSYWLVTRPAQRAAESALQDVVPPPTASP